MNCGICGNYVSSGHRFCTSCGQPVGIKVPFIQLCQRPSAQGPGLYIEALKYYQSGEYTRTESAVIELLFKFPRDSRYHNLLGSAYVKLDKPNLALLHFEKALEIDNDLWEPYYNCGIIFYRQLETKRAKLCFQKSFQINQKHFQSLYNLGTIYLKEGKYQEAVAAFSKVRELAPDYTKNNINLEVALKKLN